MLAAYATTLVLIDPGPNGMSRWISLSGLVVGSAVVVRLLTERIEDARASTCAAPPAPIR